MMEPQLAGEETLLACQEIVKLRTALCNGSGSEVNDLRASVCSHGWFRFSALPLPLLLPVLQGRLLCGATLDR